MVNRFAGFSGAAIQFNIGQALIYAPGQHILACALEIERQHCIRATVFVAERIGELALVGDSAGVAMRQRIAAAMDKLKTVQAGRLRTAVQS